MTLGSLQHLVHTVQSLAHDHEIIVLGSASLLASFPELGEGSECLTVTYDADLCPQPFDDATARRIHQLLGEAGAFHLEHGYHADVLRDAIFATLPDGWRDRLVPVPGCERGLALDPHDLAATKLCVGRAKDLALVRHLALSGRLDRRIVAQRIDAIVKLDRQIIAAAEALHRAFEGAS